MRPIRRASVAALLVTGLLVAAHPPGDAAPDSSRAAPVLATTIGATDDTSGPRGIELKADGVLPPGRSEDARVRVRKYPGKVIRYWANVPKSYQWVVRTAAESWNRTGLDMTFKPSGRAKSDLTIEVDNIGFEGGLATLGYAPRRYRWVKLSPGMMSPGGLGGGLSFDERRVYTMHIAAHELGHTLGLGHRNTRCGLMGPTLWIGVCKAWTTDPGYYNCQVVDATDLGRAVSLYGGRRTLAPAACSLDPLPPALTDVAIEGGGPEGDPARISWQAPDNAPAGTKVQILRRTGTSCDFAATGDLSTPAHFPNAIDVSEVALEAGPQTFTTPVNARDYCFGVHTVNASGADSDGPIATDTLTLYVPEPPPPTVHWVRVPYSARAYGGYQAEVDLPAGFADATLWYRAGTTGNCPTAFDDSWEQAWDDGEGRYSTDVDGVGEAPCFSFVVQAGGRAGEIVAFQTGGEPGPGAPAATGVEHRLGGSYRIAVGAVPRFGHELLALVRPQGQCAPGAWPDGELPDDHLAYSDDDGYDVYDEDIARACVTVYLIDGQGRIGPGVALQAAPAPAPPKPVLADVTLVTAEEAIRFHTTVDEARFQLVAVVADTCFTTWTEDLPGDRPYDDSGWWYVDNYEAHPCLSVFTMNADGVHSAGATHQL